MEGDYSKYRGKCKEMVDKLCKEDNTLIPVRGHYICWSWGKQPHWWAVNQNGDIIDSSINQFPKPHIGEYVPFNGIIECSQCGKEVPELRAQILSNTLAVCSGKCYGLLVGIKN